MSIKDEYLALSDAQAITATADSENVIDFGAGEDAWGAAKTAPEVAQGRPLYLNVSAKEAFDSGGDSGTLTVALETCATVDGSYAAALTTAALAQSALTEGAVVLSTPLPLGLSRFNKLTYTVASGPFTAGKLDAWIGFEPIAAA